MTDSCCQCYYICCAQDIVASTWDVALVTHLTDTELSKVQSYVFRKDQERSLLSILLQKYVIRKYLNSVLAAADICDTSPQQEEKQSSFYVSQSQSKSEKMLSFSSCPKEETQFLISRTRENKPYLVVKSESLARLVAKSGDTFNYNVSHHGDFVGIVSHTHSLVGMDLVDISTRVSWVDSVKEYIDIYKKQLSDKEVESILACSSEEKCYTHFYVLWSLKEAYVKAVGVGMGIDLKQVEFDVLYTDQEATSATTTTTEEGQMSSAIKSSSSSSSSSSSVPVSSFESSYVRGTAEVRLNGASGLELKRHDHWKFEFVSLDGRHVMTVARGLPSSALQAFKTAAWPSYDLEDSCKRDTDIVDDHNNDNDNNKNNNDIANDGGGGGGGGDTTAVDKMVSSTASCHLHQQAHPQVGEETIFSSLAQDHKVISTPMSQPALQLQFPILLTIDDLLLC